MCAERKTFSGMFTWNTDSCSVTATGVPFKHVALAIAANIS